ncbi:hypothetical protein, partial [Mesorhizobium sp. M5C.F.Ca.IN.020.29.1.1]|uniref:hypothetical protein n=1 Tax=Mesorhizobium sp. M5C.F.Ca.IN.020.29.1.1 TaxID=2496770 RepID=UPI0019D0AB5D
HYNSAATKLESGFPRRSSVSTLEKSCPVAQRDRAPMKNSKSPELISRIRRHHLSDRPKLG